MLYEPLTDLKDLRGAPVIYMQDELPAIGEHLIEVDDVPDRCPCKGEDTLPVIPTDPEATPVAVEISHKQFQDFHLGWIGILELIHQNVRIKLLVFLSDLVLIFQHPVCLHKQVIQIQEQFRFLGMFILPIDLPDLHHDEITIVALLEIIRSYQVILRKMNLPQYTACGYPGR